MYIQILVILNFVNRFHKHIHINYIIRDGNSLYFALFKFIKWMVLLSTLKVKKMYYKLIISRINRFSKIKLQSIITLDCRWQKTTSLLFNSIFNL